MENDARLAAGFPPGLENGFISERNDRTTDSPISDLILIPDRVSDGRVLDKYGEPITTPEHQTHIYVVGECGIIYIALEHERRREVPGAVKHNTILRGAPAFGAGEIVLADGVVVKINPISGTYKPPAEIMEFIFYLLKRANVLVQLRT